MKLIKNESLQGIQLFIKTPNGGKYEYLAPQKKIVVSESSISSQVKNLANRRKLRILNYS